MCIRLQQEFRYRPCRVLCSGFFRHRSKPGFRCSLSCRFRRNRRLKRRRHIIPRRFFLRRRSNRLRRDPDSCCCSNRALKICIFRCSLCRRILRRILYRYCRHRISAERLCNSCCTVHCSLRCPYRHRNPRGRAAVFRRRSRKFFRLQSGILSSIPDRYLSRTRMESYRCRCPSRRFPFRFVCCRRRIRLRRNRRSCCCSNPVNPECIFRCFHRRRRFRLYLSGLLRRRSVRRSLSSLFCIFRICRCLHRRRRFLFRFVCCRRSNLLCRSSPEDSVRNFRRLCRRRMFH